MKNSTVKIIGELTKKIRKYCPELYETTTEFRAWTGRSSMVEVWKPIQLEHALIAFTADWIRDRDGRWVFFESQKQKLLMLLANWDFRQGFGKQKPIVYEQLNAEIK